MAVAVSITDMWEWVMEERSAMVESENADHGSRRRKNLIRKAVVEQQLSPASLRASVGFRHQYPI